MSLVSLSAQRLLSELRQCLCQLLATHSDNNVKLIVIDQLNMLKNVIVRYWKACGDILRALAIPNVDIRKRALSIATDLLSPQNIEIVIQKLEGLRQSQSESDAEEYRAQLAKTLLLCSEISFHCKYSRTCCRTLCSSSKSSSSQKQQQAAMTVIHYVRDITQTYENLRRCDKQVDRDISSIDSTCCVGGRVLDVGKYCESVDTHLQILRCDSKQYRTLPLTAKIDRSEGTTMMMMI